MSHSYHAERDLLFTLHDLRFTVLFVHHLRLTIHQLGVPTDLCSLAVRTKQPIGLQRSREIVGRALAAAHSGKARPSVW